MNNEMSLGLSFDIESKQSEQMIEKAVTHQSYLEIAQMYLNEAVLKIPYLGVDIYFWGLIN